MQHAPLHFVVNLIMHGSIFWVQQAMSIELTDSLKILLKETAFQLKGAARRRFQAQTVMEFGYGGQLLAQKELGWDRNTIRKGIKELTSGISCVDNYSARGRLSVESHIPNLLEDIKKLVDSQSQTDPTFKSQRLYIRLSASEVRKQLIEKFGYSNEELPSEETIRIKLNDSGYSLKRVAKVLPRDGALKNGQAYYREMPDTPRVNLF